MLVGIIHTLFILLISKGFTLIVAVTGRNIQFHRIVGHILLHFRFREFLYHSFQVHFRLVPLLLLDQFYLDLALFSPIKIKKNSNYLTVGSSAI